jgi:hypothetical protein
VLNIEVSYASSLDAAWDRAKDIADKFFGEREYCLEYVEAVVSNHEEPFTYKVTIHAVERSSSPYLADALRLVG